MRTDKILSKYDCERLQRIVSSIERGERLDKTIVEKIEYYLAHAKQVEPKKIKPHIVTMNSQFVLADLGSGKKDVYSLVFPEESDARCNRISVFSGIGAQLIGCPTGTVIKGVHGSNQYLMIEKIVYQPEASGDYHL